MLRTTWPTSPCHTSSGNDACGEHMEQLNTRNMVNVAADPNMLKCYVAIC